MHYQRMESEQRGLPQVRRFEGDNAEQHRLPGMSPFMDCDPMSPMNAAAYHLGASVTVLKRSAEDVTDELGSVAERGPSGLCSTFWNMMALTLGIGMLSIPYATEQSRYLVCVATLFCIGLLSIASVSSTVRARRLATELTRRTDLTLMDTVRVFLGPRWRNITAASVFISQLGVCIGYEIFICSTLEKLFPCLSFTGWLGVLQLPLLLFSAVRSLRLLSLVSSCCVFCVSCGVLLASVLMLREGERNGWAPVHAITHVDGCVFVFGVVSLAFGGVGAVGMTVEQSMARPEWFTPILCAAVLTAVALYASFGFLAYASLGNTLQGVITLSFPAGEWVGIASSICFCLQLLCAFPLNMYPLWKFLEEAMFGANAASSPTVGYGGEVNPYLTGVRVRKTALRNIGVLAIACVVWLCRNNFATLLSIVGSCSCALYMFLIPGLIQLRLVKYRSFAGILAVLKLIVGVAAPLAAIATKFI